MKTIILNSLFIFISFAAFSQASKNVTKNDVRKIVAEIEDSIGSAAKTRKEIIKLNQKTNQTDTSVSKKGKLVNDYTFRRRFAKDFTKVLSSDNASSTLKKYATLDVDEEKAKVSFSPFTFKSANVYKPFNFFGSVALKGEIDNDNIFTVFNESGYNKKFELALNFNWVVGGGNSFYTNPSESKAYEQSCRKLLAKIEEDFNGVIEKSESDERVKIDNKDLLTSKDTLKRRMLDKYADYEEKAADDFWIITSRKWINVSFSPINAGSNAALDPKSNTIVNKDFYDPALKVSYNWLRTRVESETSFFLNIQGEVSNKNSFTGLTPTEWNQIQRLSDTTFLVKETKKVYALDSTYSSTALPAFSLQFIKTFKIGEFMFGFDLTNKLDMLVPKTLGGENLLKNSFSGGLIIPFTNNEGERKINIEIFYLINSYLNASIDNTDMFGIKFSVPILEK